MEPDTEDKVGLGFVRLSMETLVPIKKFKTRELNILEKYYRPDKVNYILTGIHPIPKEKLVKKKQLIYLIIIKKLDEFSVDDLFLTNSCPMTKELPILKIIKIMKKNLKILFLV